MDTIDDTDEKMEAIGLFLEELQTSANAETVVRRYATMHPQWVSDFLEEAVMGRMLTMSRADEVLPDLSQLTDFRIIRGIAAGGMGIVYEAEQISLQRRVALKVRHGSASPEREERFDLEQRVLAQLHQSHIVPIYQSGRCGAWQYFAMLFIEGATLHQVLRTAWEIIEAGQRAPTFIELVNKALHRNWIRDGISEHAEVVAESTRLNDATSDVKLPTQSTKSIQLPTEYFRTIAATMVDVAEAVAHAHTVEVIHRDIKPSNIMIDRSACCWLIDFGLADSMRQSNESRGPSGTPGYMAPELLASPTTSATPLSDVWGLGITLFESLSLRRPFTDARIPLRKLVTNVPADLVAICERALRVNPQDRYKSAKELADDLRRWLDGRSTVARPVSPWRAVGLWAKRNQGWATAITCAVLLLVSTTVAVVLREHRRADRAELLRQAADERARLGERDRWVGEAGKLQTGQLSDGWSDLVWENLQKANATKPDDHIRDLAVNSLRGLDAKMEQSFQFGSSSVAFSKDGKSLAIGGWDGYGKYPVRSASVGAIGSEPSVISKTPGEGPVAFDSNGNAVQLVHVNDELTLRSIADGRSIWSIPLPVKKEDQHSFLFTLSSDATWIASTESGRTRIWKSTSTTPFMTLQFAAEAIAFSAKGEYVAMAVRGERRRIEVSSLEINAKEFIVELPSGSLTVNSLAFGRNPRRSTKPQFPYVLASGDAGGTVTLWDIASKLPLNFCRGLPREVYALAFNPDGTLLVTGGREELRIWDTRSGKSQLRMRPPTGIDYITGIVFSPKGDRIAVSSQGIFYLPCTTVWNLSNCRGLCNLSGLSSQIESVVVSPDGKTVAALAQNWELGVWDVESGQLKFVRELPPGAFSDNAGLTFNQDGNKISYSVGSLDHGEVFLIDALTGAELRSWKLPPGLQNRLAFVGNDQLWHFQVEIDNGKALPSMGQPWKTNPRVGRVRNLLAAEPGKVIAEYRDAPRHIYKALMTPDGTYTAIDGTGDTRKIAMMENATGKVMWSQKSQYTAQSSDMLLETKGNWLAVSSSDSSEKIRHDIRDGRQLTKDDVALLSASDAKDYRCIYFLADGVPGCYLFASNSQTPLVNLSPGVTINLAEFDPSGGRLIMGGRDGSVIVCHIEIMMSKLKSLR